jgi:hypothetical protein
MSLLQELWHTKAWRLFPLFLIYVTGSRFALLRCPGELELSGTRSRLSLVVSLRPAQA